MYGLGSIDIAQRNLGVPRSGTWDPQTTGALAPYQSGQRAPLKMAPTGKPDAATLINLGYYDPIEELPKAQRDYLEGGAKPGTFWRDLGTCSNQVPQWVWLVLGAALIGIGYYVYRTKGAGAKR